ncbi:FAD-dependent oxidoreductase [Colwellia sp. MEBiC06753]
MKQVDVIVVGGGMVGAASALSLANLGLSVVILERLAPIAFDAKQPIDLRVSAISVASENLLKDLNAWQQILQWRACPYRRLGVWEKEQAYAEFSAEQINSPYLGHIVENRLIQLSLWQQLTQHSNIELLIGEDIQAIEQDERFVSVSTSQSTISAKLLVAADGANSYIRKQVGIGCTGWNYQQSAMLINVSTELPQQDITWQQFKPTGPLAMLPLPSKEPSKEQVRKEFGAQVPVHQASLVWYHHKDRIKQLNQLSKAELKQQILAEFPQRLGDISVIDHASFPLTRQHANHYFSGRVVLLGDAAHTINPLAGQGVNLGFKDVKALRTVIAKAIGEGECWHQQATLKAYEQQRRPDNLLMMTAMDSLYQMFSNELPLLKFIRNLGLYSAEKAPKVIKDKVLAYACGL